MKTATGDETLSEAEVAEYIGTDYFPPRRHSVGDTIATPLGTSTVTAITAVMAKDARFLDDHWLYTCADGSEVAEGWNRR